MGAVEVEGWGKTRISADACSKRTGYHAEVVGWCIEASGD